MLDREAQNRDRSFTKGLKTEVRNYQQRCEESAASKWDGVDEDGQKDRMAYFCDRDSDCNFVLNPSLHWKPVKYSEQ